MRTGFMGPWVVLGVAVGLASACGGSDTKRKAPFDTDDGGDAAAGGRPGSGGSASSGGAQAGGAPNAGGTPATGGAPEAGPGDSSVDQEAGPSDASDAADTSVRDVAPEAAPPPPPWECVDGGNDVVDIFACRDLDLGAARFDPVAKTVTIDMPPGYFLDGVDFFTDAIDVRPTTQVYYQAGSAPAGGVFIDGKVPQGTGSRAVYSLPELPDDVTSLRFTIHRVRDAFGRFLVGAAAIDFEPSQAPSDAGADAGVLWTGARCGDDRPFGPPLAYRCSELGAVTYDKATGEVVLDAAFPGRAAYATIELTRYVGGVPETVYRDGSPDSVDGTRSRWQLGVEPGAVALTVSLQEVYGYCDAYYYGESTHRLVAPGGVDGGLPPPPPDAGSAADAAVDEFWQSSCSYEKFFWRF